MTVMKFQVHNTFGATLFGTFFFVEPRLVYRTTTRDCQHR